MGSKAVIDGLVLAEKARRANVGDTLEVPTGWDFDDKRGEAHVTLHVACVDKLSVHAHFAKEGLLVDFTTKNGKFRYSFVARTYAPLVPGWCRAEPLSYGIRLVVSKARPGPWDGVGELCGPDEAGLADEAASIEEARKHEVSTPALEETESKNEVEGETAAGEGEGEGDEALRESGVIRKLGFIAARSFEGTKEGYVFLMGAQGLGYYEDVGPWCIIAPPSPMEVNPEGEDDEPMQSKWDWVQEARSGGSSDPLKKTQQKPAFKRGFIDDAAPAKDAGASNEHLITSTVGGFVMPGLDGDDDLEEEDEEAYNAGRAVEVPWAPTIGLQTKGLVLELD